MVPPGGIAVVEAIMEVCRVVCCLGLGCCSLGIVWGEDLAMGEGEVDVVLGELWRSGKAGWGHRSEGQGRGSGAALRVVTQCFLSFFGAFSLGFPQHTQCSCKRRTSLVRTAPQTGLMAAAVAVSESVGQLPLKLGPQTKLGVFDRLCPQRDQNL